MRLVDYHNHTWLCHHARGGIADYLPRAAFFDLEELGFAEHSHWMPQTEPGRRVAPTRAEMEQYLREMQDWIARPAGDRHGVVLRMGLEADWIPEALDEARAFIADHPFDFVFGSVHHLRLNGDWRIVWGLRKGDPIEEFIEGYFDAVRDLAQSGLCDVLSHLDVPARCDLLPPDLCLRHAERILPYIVDAGVAIELNTSGRDHKHGRFFPEPRIVELYASAGVPFTLGSDGHAPWNLCRHRGEALALLRRCGVREVLAFEKRRRRAIPLDGGGA